ncbi:MAG: MFS transporter [Betaproteobacteria bacterium]
MIRNTLRALRHRNFRLFIAGQMCSLIGYWMQNIAQSWLLYRLTESTTLLGVLAFAGSVPILVLAPFAGLWSDRANLHRLMFTIQLLEMIQAATLAALAVAGLIAPWHIVTLSMLLGILVAIELPVRHAYLLELIGDRTDLPNAVAVTSMMANTGRLIGPAVAGIAIASIGEAGCFVINTLSYIAVVVTFLMIRVTPSARAATHASVMEGLNEGLRYAWNSIPIRLLLALLATTAFLAMPYAALMPALTRDVLGGGAEEMGFLVGAAGLGGVAGTVYLASRRSVRGLVAIIVYAIFGAGTALALVPWSHRLWLALALLVVIGFCLLVTSVSVNMILQTIVDDDKRGRVMSLYTAAFLGVSPFGSLAAGALADAIGVSATLTLSGIGCACGALYLARKRPQIREHITPIYARLGINPK